ncbi:hypothetical protein HOY80DRAFT_980236 [Tuber brumale]|nr:hypothetical protein HOY80DRAFT_980236 [Tuber brumale]
MQSPPWPYLTRPPLPILRRAFSRLPVIRSSSSTFPSSAMADDLFSYSLILILSFSCSFLLSPQSYPSTILQLYLTAFLMDLFFFVFRFFALAFSDVDMIRYPICIVLGQKPSLVGPSTTQNTPKWPKFGVMEIANCTPIS